MRNHPFLLVVVLTFLGTGLCAQTAELDKGDKAFERFDFQEALYFYETALETQPKDPAITRRIASTYQRMGQMTMAAEWYQKTLELDASNAEDMLRYAEILKNLQQYDEAIQWYEMYVKLKPSDLRAKSHLADKQYYRDLFADTARYSMKKFKLNNENPSLGITLFEDERFLVSAVQLDQSGSKSEANISPYLDVYLCDLSDKEELVNPVRLDKNVNSDFHDGPAFYCFADKTLYITRNNMKGKKVKYNKNGYAILKIYESHYENGKWSEAEELKFNDDGFSNGHPCLTKDGQTMYFYSDRDGGFGGADIYVCYKTVNGWSQPINLGANVNTEGNEQFPFLGEDGFLYFSSNGHAGLGGMDIFASEQVSEVWQTPINLGSPINSNSDDFSLVYDKESDNGFFCSNRGGLGDDDMYFYKHISIRNMIVAGTIKANVPNVSLAGERIQIRKLNSGEVTYQALDEFESFEFSANAGDQVEIVMMNAEYFDPESPVVTYNVQQTILDPFVNIGEKQASLTKAPAHEGQLSLYKDGGLAKSTNLLKGDPKDHPILEGIDKDASANLNDKSILTWSEEEKARRKAAYDLKIIEANRLYSEGKLAQARISYEEASILLPGETFPQQQLALTDAAISAQTEKSFSDRIAVADKLFEQGKYKEAQTEYLAAMAIKPGDAHSKAQLDKINGIETSNKNDGYNSKLAVADKLYQQEKWGEAKAAYKAAILLNPEDTYAKGQMSMIDDKIKMQEAQKVQNKFDDKIEEADKLFSQRKWAEAKAAYKAASLLKPEDSYAKKQLENVDTILSPKKKEVVAEEPVKKAPSEFELGVPVIDLVALAIDNVIFDYNKSFVREEDKATLDAIYKLMVEKPDTKLLIRAHCDSRGSMAYNQSLSMSRAMAVQGYLMQKGIKRDRFKSEWFGEQRPLNGCIDDVPCEEDQYEVNRRAEFKLVAR